MILELISTGNEVLNGEISDTNSAWIAQTLIDDGYWVSRVSTVGDSLDDLVRIFQERSQVADVLLINGGLGPTEDDLSAKAASLAAGVDLEFSDHWASVLTERYKEREMPSNNMKQAWVPEGAQILSNPRGTACGFSMKLNRATIFFTPGVPYEMKAMLKNEIIPVLLKIFPQKTKESIKRFFTFGLSEARVGALASPLSTINASIGFRASYPLIEVKVQGLSAHIEPVSDSIRAVLGDFIFCEDRGDAVSVIQNLLLQKRKTLALAESCTGGLIASQLVSMPGSSGYFRGGVVAYTNEMKENFLNVPSSVLERHGAVSNEVARAMAIGIQKATGVDFALSVTGVAGPGGGTEEKPVGTVSFSLAHPNGCFAQILKFPEWGRHRIRYGSAMICLDLLRRLILDLPLYPTYDYAKLVSKLES